MSRADRIFIDMCKDILENGVSTEGEKSARTGKTEAVPTPSRNSESSTGTIYPKNFRQLHLERQPLRAARTKCSGSGRRSLIISKI